MTDYTVLLTREVTQFTQVSIDAESEEEAIEQAREEVNSYYWDDMDERIVDIKVEEG